MRLSLLASTDISLRTFSDYDTMQQYFLIFQTKIHPPKLKNVTIFSTKTKDKYLFLGKYGFTFSDMGDNKLK